MVFETLADFRAYYEGVTFETARYGRSGTSTTFEFQSAMADACSTESCIATSSGLAAIAAVVGAHTKPGAKILFHRDVYPPTRVLAETGVQQLGCTVEFFDNVDQLADVLDSSVTLIVIEVPGSLTMSMIDVRQVCDIAADLEVPVACDSTWGTPLWFDAHALGVDISIHAATKYIAGHSDLMLGAITGTYAALETTRSWCAHHGSHAAPDVCWLALRGLRTLAVRLTRHQTSALNIAAWLQTQPQVAKVLFPALPDDPGHDLWKTQFGGAPGPFTIELQRCNESAFAAFIDGLQMFGLGTSWGGFESLVMPAIPHHLRSKSELPDDGRLVRLHIGLEHPDDLKSDLAQALTNLTPAPH
jgi:cystathionine beta-lyase